MMSMIAATPIVAQESTLDEKMENSVQIYSSIEQVSEINNFDLPKEFIISETGTMSVRSTSGYEKWTRISWSCLDWKRDLGRHPQLPSNYLYDSYSFTENTQVQMSVNIGYGIFGIGVAAYVPGVSGSITAESSKYSHINICGTPYRYTYRVEVYNGAGIKIGTRTEYKSAVRDQHPIVIYSDGKAGGGCKVDKHWTVANPGEV